MLKVSSQDVFSLGQSLIATAVAMNDRGINNGTSGNVSARFGDGMLVTPSGVAYDDLAPADLIQMTFNQSWTAVGEAAVGNGIVNDGIESPVNTDADRAERRPSSEWRFHLDILKSRPEVNAIVHAHPISATALSIHDRTIGAFHYMVGVAGGHDIRCAPYATFGTEQLSVNAIEALQDRKACLLSHHGIIAVGPNLDAALRIAVEVEVLASQYLAALALGEPPLLSSDQMDEVLAKMASPDGYGSSPPS